MKKKLLETSVPKFYMVLMIGISVLMIGSYFSYAMFTVNKEKKNAITIITGNLTGVLKVDGEIKDTLEVSAKSTKTFTVELSNNNERKARYNFYYKGIIPSNVTIGYVKEEGVNTPPGEAGTNMEKNGTSGSSNVYKITVNNKSASNVTINLGYKIGLDYNDLTLPENGHLIEEYKKEGALGEEPTLASNMIPVKYDGTNWVKADTSDTWYDYNEQWWANAVTVSEASRANYLSADANTPISMDDINTMWVWIPRYSYTIGSEDGTNYYGKQGEYLDTAPTQALPGEIDVKFIPTSTKDTGSAQYKVSEGVGGWRTPAGFTFGGKELSGVWVAKFETSNKDGIYDSDDSYGSDNSNLTPIVKPKVTSWRGVRVSMMETATMNMTKENNIYGLSASEVDSHMMKNSEWALVVYLSQSKYGKLGNESYTGSNKQIYHNNYAGYKTGCSAGSSSALDSFTCVFEYDNLTDRGSGKGSGGGGASTTGNIYGVYDMNGCADEYVMGNYNNYSGPSKRNNSGYSGPLDDGNTFNGISFPENKYYDLYTTNSTSTACNGKICTSHALSEVAGWYHSRANMVTADSPWLIRGGDYLRSDGKGVFCFSVTAGYASDHYSFRLVLTP